MNKKAVIYARYSSDKQTEQSIEGQIRVCKEFAERNNYQIINEYIDRAISGKDDNRPAFQQMIDDAEKKEFQYIICYKLDRFARNKYHSVFYKHKLEQFDVKVLSATEAISDSPEGKLVEGLLEMLAEMYSADLSQKTKRGIRESVIKGNFIGGYILYGYKAIGEEHNRKIAIDEDKAQAVRYMFNELAKGRSKKDVVNELNQQGFRTYNNKLFTISNLQENLKNKKYIGEYNLYEIENNNYYPAIIDKETFYKVQEQLARNKKLGATKKAKTEYLLTGKAYCGHCGETLVGVAGTSRSKERHNYYVCTKRYKEHKCDKKYEQKGFLEWYVVEQTMLHVLNRSKLEGIADKVLAEYDRNINAIKIKQYEDKLSQIDKDIKKCFDMYFNADSEEIKKLADSKCKDLEIQKQDVSTEISKLKLATKIKHTKEEIISCIKLFFKGDELDEAYQKRIIDIFINKIFIFDDKIVIYYNLFNDCQVSYIEMLEDCDITLSGSYSKCSGEPK